MATPRYAYVSALPYEDPRIHAAALYCSDGRLGEQVDDFLHQGLRLPRYDRLACPGGPVGLSGRFLAFWETRGVEQQLRFLMHVHELHKLVLIAHAGCAYYREHLRLPEAQAEREQVLDLERARAAVLRLDRTLDVQCYMARVIDQEVAFERMRF